uniref:Heterogeneous nuclear ribonucleoprotein D0 n=1 Tax=Anthurium amnicola TaxID=1678845 RepID=A0A1D1XEH3_9ARAE
MKDSKKRSLEESECGDLPSAEDLKLLLDPLRKDQLVEILLKLGTQYPSVAEEIKGVASADPVHRKLFVRGLSWETTSETLCAAFQIHGEIEEGAVITDKATGKSRGYGFITYQHMESSQRALKEPSKLIDGRLAVCNLACEGLSSTSATTDQALRKIYIGGLSPDISSEALLNYFGRHGEVEEGSVAYDKETNKSRGFGFVTYRTVEATKKALDDPDKNLGGRNITVKLADSHRHKIAQSQLPSAVVPMAIPVPTAYVHPGKTHATTASVGYAPYPQTVTTYPAMYQNASSHYPPQPPISYPPVGANKESVGLHAAAPAGVSGHPYYPTVGPW